VAGDHFYLKFWAKLAPMERKRRAKKRKTAVFYLTSHCAWRYSATTKFLCVKTVSDKVVRHSLA